MRSHLLVFLLVLLPLQLGWAAAAPYLHERASGAVHVKGGQDLALVQTDASHSSAVAHKGSEPDVARQSDIRGADLDCSTCHSNNPLAPQTSHASAFDASQKHFSLEVSALKSSSEPDRPERPQWRALA